MRLLKVTVPAGEGVRVKAIAFSSGINAVSIHQTTKYSADNEEMEMDVVDLDVSTPRAKAFLDRLLAESYPGDGNVSFEIRDARSLVTGDEVAELTVPLVQPATDIYEELWQFSHITYGSVGRVLISAGLLAYGIIESRTLIIVSGLLFLPVLPMIMAISFGCVSRQRSLALQGLKALLITLALVFAGSVIVASVVNGPVQFSDLGTPLSGFLISLAVGTAATLASIDDTGRRELIGLAAASQVGIVPAWIGVSLVLGIPAGTSNYDLLAKVALSPETLSRWSLL